MDRRGAVPTACELSFWRTEATCLVLGVRGWVNVGVLECDGKRVPVGRRVGRYCVDAKVFGGFREEMRRVVNCSFVKPNLTRKVSNTEILKIMELCV